VLDVGTGTGVLAIAACRTGAGAVLGVDTNPDAVRNARDNARENDVTNCVTVREGSAEETPDAGHDLVAANITRRVLLGLMPDLVSRLAPDGTLLLSGLLQPQRDSMLAAARDHALTLDAEATEDGWWAARFSRSAPS
jgi:ribosomal protein L11 methyltransferase